MEIVFRALVIFGFLWLVTRVTGRSTLGELSTFQLLLFVTMGDLVQQAVTQQDYSVTAAVLAVSVFALLTVVLTWVNRVFPRARPITHGRALLLVRDGEPVENTMRGATVSLDDLMAAAREAGLRRFADIDLAVLEADGKISFFAKQDKDEGAPAGPPAGDG